MKHILLFGAGKSATVLIDYLKDISVRNNYQVTVADGVFENAALKVGKHTHVQPKEINVEDEISRQKLISGADVVISLLPPALHYLVAKDCIRFSKHLLTASYIDEQIKSLEQEIKSKGLLFLCEMGLDPGIDHMSAMQIIDNIQKEGGLIHSFKSHCGGLVAPESDNNPWHYKISWNPRNVVLAGKAGAVYKENNEIKKVPYEQLFSDCKNIEVSKDLTLAYYPNRDSLSYISTYNLQQAHTFIRTTLRYPEFCFGWKNIIDLQLTNETEKYNTDGLTLSAFYKQHFDKYGFKKWLDELLNSRLQYAQGIMENLLQILQSGNEQPPSDKDILLVDAEGQLNQANIKHLRDKAAATVGSKMEEANLALNQLFFLGLDSDEEINKGICSAADVLQFALEKKLVLQPHDKDMVVMQHEIEYSIQGRNNLLKSTLMAIGEDSTHTAMAKTVGLPLGIAATLILEDKIPTRGLHIPIVHDIYFPVLKELEAHNIIFKEEIIKNISSNNQ